MSGKRTQQTSQGPFFANQIRSGDPYELSDGHPLYCWPTGGRGGSAQGLGATVVLNDPAVESGGVEVGFSPRPDMLRAPDVAVGGVTDEPGWVRGVPALAIEYADTGQNEADLQLKISEFLREGTKFVWVVRLAGPRRVEVYQPVLNVQVVDGEGELRAPGVLANPVPVMAFFDKEAARRADLRNLLQRFGYGSIDEVREEAARDAHAKGRVEGRLEGQVEGRLEGQVEGRVEGQVDALFAVLNARGLAVPDELREAVRACTSKEQLEAWIVRAATCSDVTELLKG